MAGRGGKMVWLLGQGQLRVLGKNLYKAEGYYLVFLTEVYFNIFDSDIINRPGVTGAVL